MYAVVPTVAGVQVQDRHPDVLLLCGQTALRVGAPGIYRSGGASPCKQLSGRTDAEISGKRRAHTRSLSSGNLLEPSSILLVLDYQGLMIGDSVQVAQRTWEPRHQRSDWRGSGNSVRVI